MTNRNELRLSVVDDIVLPRQQAVHEALLNNHHKNSDLKWLASWTGEPFELHEQHRLLTNALRPGDRVENEALLDARRAWRPPARRVSPSGFRAVRSIPAYRTRARSEWDLPSSRASRTYGPEAPDGRPRHMESGASSSPAAGVDALRLRRPSQPAPYRRYPWSGTTSHYA